MLTLCLLGNFECFLSSGDFFQNQLFSKISLSVKQFEPRYIFVGPGLGPNCLQRLYEDYIRVEELKGVTQTWLAYFGIVLQGDITLSYRGDN